VLRPYRELAAAPGVPALLTWSMLGRLHLMGTPLAMSFLIAGWTGSYALAGVIGAALMAGLGVAGPVRGRAADRAGAAGLLVTLGMAYGAGLVLVAFVPSWLPAGWWPVEGVLAFVVGLANPPVVPVIRATWPRMLTGTALNSVYTVEATFTELLYAVGPLLAAAVVTLLNPAMAIVVCGVLAALGSLGFAHALSRAGQSGPVPVSGTASGRRAALLTAPGVLAALGLMMCLVGALLTVDMTIVAWARDIDLPILAGILGAVWALGSFAGGLVAGGLTGRPRLRVRVLLTLLGLAALVPVLPPVIEPASPWLVGVILLFGGAAISPAVAAVNITVSELSPPERRAEAYGWLSTSSTVGFSIALPCSGLLLDHGGPAFSAAGSFLLALVAVVLTLFIPMSVEPAGPVAAPARA
jgi:hypothetical protein